MIGGASCLKFFQRCARLTIRSPASLDYALLRDQKNPCPSTARPTHILICAEFNAHVLAPLLTNLFAEQGLCAVVSVAAVGEPELLQGLVLDGAPDYLCLLPHVQFLERRHRVSAQDEEFVRHEQLRWTRAAEEFCRTRSSKILLADLALSPSSLSAPTSGTDWRSLDVVAQTINQGWYEWCAPRADVDIVRLRQLSATSGLDRWFDQRLWYAAQLPCALDMLPCLALEIVRTVMRRMNPLKVVVVDFDNTLWGGEIGDLSPQQLVLGESPEGAAFVDFQHYLKELSAQGVVLVGCTRNLAPIAQLPFEQNPHMALRLADFAHIEASPGSKVEALGRIRALLNVGLESILFLDDSSFERSMVQSLLPEVHTPELPADPAARVSFLRTLVSLDGRVSETGRQRNDLAKSELARVAAKATYPSEAEFLRSLRMIATLREVQPLGLPRIHELLERTNQYNFTGARFSPREVEARLADPAHLCLQLVLEDRFGSHGMIAVVFVEKGLDRWRIENFVMSCRVASRGVEEAFFNHLKTLLLSAPPRKELRIDFRPTSKNAHCREVLRRNGFTLTGTSADTETWCWDDQTGLAAHWITHG